MALISLLKSFLPITSKKGAENLRAPHYFAEKNVLLRCLRILPKSDHKKLPFLIVLQVVLALVDLIAVGIIGVIAALSISSIQSSPQNSQIVEILEFMGILDFDLQSQATILGLLAASLLIFRTLTSVYITRKTLFFLSNRGAKIASDVFAKLIAQPMANVRIISTQDAVQAIIGGTSAITLGVIGAFLTTFADAILTLVMLIGLFLLNPIMAGSMLIFFGLTAFLLYKLMSGRAHHLGVLQANQSILVNETIVETLSSYRELLVRNRRNFYSRKLTRNRYEAAVVLARVQFLPNVSKYIIEIMIVLGAVMISAFEFIAQDATSAIAVLSVFLASATRIAPAMMRIQQGAISIKGATGGAERTLDLLDQLFEVESLPVTNDVPIFSHADFSPRILLDKVEYSYFGSSNPTLSNISLLIEPGDFVAVVGPSGAGKTTLIDVMLGIAIPDSGTVSISNRSPLEAISTWPGAISYVPQDILIVNGSIAENVSFGFPLENVPSEKIIDALTFAELEGFVKNLPMNENSQVGERGTKISGGQRQRLGIARAMLTCPKLLVLDEATSTLDAQTEQAISDSIKKLKGSVTVVMIAHRLSTVANADLVVYMDKGSIKASGTLEEVRIAVPDFDLQAKLMGL
jgi:ABC-type multidrug transport system fused ATPase/permease subunit